MHTEAHIPMHIEDLNDAIRSAINELGGFKVVGFEMRPERGAMEAGKWLADCLNPSKRDRLNPEQLAFIRQKANQAGCHILASYEMREAGYARPIPIVREDQSAQLQREYIAAVKAMTAMQLKIENSMVVQLRAVGSKQ